MDLLEIFLTCNRDRLLDMYEELKSMSCYTGMLDLDTVNSSELINAICDNIIFVENEEDQEENYNTDEEVDG